VASEMTVAPSFATRQFELKVAKTLTRDGHLKSSLRSVQISSMITTHSNSRRSSLLSRNT